MLKFTTITAIEDGGSINIHPLVTPPENACLVSNPVKGRNAFIIGEALELAGFYLPCFYDGDIAELDKDNGIIIMVLPSGEYPIICKRDQYNNYTLDLR